MPSDLDRSRAVCRVCGDSKVLAADTVEVEKELSVFSTRHSHPDAFRIDVVVAVHDEPPGSDGSPLDHGLEVPTPRPGHGL